MKNLFKVLCLLLFLFIGNSSTSQDCSTLGSDSLALQVFPMPTGPQQTVGLPLNIKVYFHFYYDSAGSNVDDYYSRQFQIVNNLNNDFYPSFNFFFVGCETSIYYNDLLNGSIDDCDFFLINNHLDGLDIHVKADLNSGASNVSVNLPGDEVMTGSRHNSDNMPKILSSTLTHEVGHALGLYHTFEGSCGITSSGFPLCDGTLSIGATSDLVSDTPADDHSNDTGNNTDCTWSSIFGTCPGETTNPFTNNFMSYFDHTCRNSFTDEQFIRMENLGKPEILYNQIEAQCCGFGDDEVVFISQNYNQNRKILGNLIVKTGATLTITGNYLFGKDQYILVERGAKLIIDGGFLSRCEESEDWQGIFVQGNPQLPQPYPSFIGNSSEAGIVIVRNGSRIEFARTAISTNDASGNPDFWGGVIEAENSEFYNNRRSIEFMQYNFANKSNFTDNIFNGSSTIVGTTYGISIWGCTNIEFNGNEFDKMEGTGIHVVDGSIKVLSGNSFTDNRRGISSMSSYPFSSSAKIGSMFLPTNNFDSNWYDIDIFSNDFIDGVQVFNNIFTSSLTGIRISGPSKFAIESNTFNSAIRDVEIINTGSQQNSGYSRIRFNTIQAPTGTLAKGNNNDVELLCNSYDCNTDINLQNYSNITSIRASQGTSFSPADNCFTSSSGAVDIVTGTNTATFDYHHFTLPCLVPQNVGNYIAFAWTNAGCTQSPPGLGGGNLEELKLIIDNH